MSIVDRPGPEARVITDILRRSTGDVPWWGFTGPPGVGKSTLIDALLGALRKRGRRIGVVAVDPTSALSEGAMLGDRVRMMRHATDDDVFIRSLATHHREGGLSDATVHCARLLELGGYDPVLIETVGVGQNEVDIAAVADVCVVMLGPGYGDDIQLIKAGLLEIADIVVVNKCDLPEANRLLKDVREEKRQNAETPESQKAEQAAESSSSCIEIVGVEAKSGKGADALLVKLLELDRTAREPAQRQRHRRRRLLGEIGRSVMQMCEQRLEAALAAPTMEELVAKLEQGQLTLDAVASQLSAGVLADLQQEN